MHGNINHKILIGILELNRPQDFMLVVYVVRVIELDFDVDIVTLGTNRLIFSLQIVCQHTTQMFKCSFVLTYLPH